MTSIPRLVVRIIDAPSIPAGAAIALCTEDGQLVGRQLSCHVSSVSDGPAIVSVAFVIDGDTVRLEGKPALH